MDVEDNASHRASEHHADWNSQHRAVARTTNRSIAVCGAYMLALTVYGWTSGAGTLQGPLVLLALLTINWLLSHLSLHARHPKRVEALRVAVGTVLVPAAYVLVDGPLHPWWPGAILMGMASAVLLGLLTQSAFWGRLAAVWYTSLLIVANLAWRVEPNWYLAAMQVGVTLMVGLMFAQVMALLGESLRDEQDRAQELAAARDALYREMEVAQEIQTLLLPRQPTMPDHVVAGQMVPADEVGGDYYDVIEVNGRGVFLAIGDVSGHGVTSGLTMMMARASLVGALEADPSLSLSELYRLLNRCVCENLSRMDIRLYMTFALLEYVGDGCFHAVGRHLPFVIYREHTKTVEEVELEGTWLGVMADLQPEHVPVSKLELGRGDLMFLYTDGIVEQEGRDGEMFGFERLKDAVQKYAPRGASYVIDTVMADLHHYAPAQEDDVTMLAINHVGQVAPVDGVRLDAATSV